MARINTRIALSLVLTLLVVPPNLSGQSEPSSAGREFIVCFPQNDRAGGGSSGADPLILYFASADGSLCSGSVDYVENGKAVSRPFSVQGSSTLLMPIDASLELASYEQNEIKGIAVRSDRNVVVYGISTKTFTSDAFLCYPLSSLDTAYIISSYPNDIPLGVIGAPGNRYSTFAVAGVEDNTRVRVFPSAPLLGRDAAGREAFEFSIDRGETRQLSMSTLDWYDATGTIITADKKIAVFSSHERASIPASNGSTDFLIEQTPAVAILGASAILSPHRSPEPGLQTLARIVAPFDNTTVSFAGGTHVLNASELVEIYFDEALRVAADKPILCAQYEPTASTNATLRPGDPFMAFVPSEMQYLNSYTFISAAFAGFDRHWINVVIPAAALPSLELDGDIVDPDLFQAVEDSDYLWAAVPLSQGEHRIRADEAFGLLSYGYGFANSYGYPAGMKTERLLEVLLDNNPPGALSSGRCNEARLHLFENEDFDSGIQSVVIDSAVNLSYEVPDFEEGVLALDIPVQLEDPFADGALYFTVHDRAGFSRSDSAFSPGFTLQIDDAGWRDSVYQGQLRCDTVTLHNYGRFAQELRAFMEVNVHLSVPPSQQAVRIPAGDSIRIPVCRSSLELGAHRDRMLALDPCDNTRTLSLGALVLPRTFGGNSQCGVELHSMMPDMAPPGVAVAFEPDALRIDFQRPPTKPSVLVIYDLFGRPVDRRNLAGSGRISLVHLAAGAYLCRISADGTAVQGVFLVER